MCANCKYKNYCVGAGKLILDEYSDLKAARRKDKGKGKGKRYGDHMHALLEEQRGVDFIPNIWKMLSEKGSVVFSATFCSPTYGLKGTPDAVYLEIGRDTKTVNITVLEDKPVPKGEYSYQLYAYAIILSDPKANYLLPEKKKLHKAKDLPEKKGSYIEDARTEPFYAALRKTIDFKEAIVFTAFNYYYNKNNPTIPLNMPEKPELFSRNFRIEDSKREIFNEVITRADELSNAKNSEGRKNIREELKFPPVKIYA